MRALKYVVPTAYSPHPILLSNLQTQMAAIMSRQPAKHRLCRCCFCSLHCRHHRHCHWFVRRFFQSLNFIALPFFYLLASFVFPISFSTKLRRDPSHQISPPLPYSQYSPLHTPVRHGDLHLEPLKIGLPNLTHWNH